MCLRLIAFLFALLACVSVSSCVHRGEPARLARGGRAGQRSLEQRILAPDLSKRSGFETRMFKSKDFTTKGYRTMKAPVGKSFHGEGKDFNVAGYQSSQYTSKKSRFENSLSPHSKKKARTFISRFEDQQARTNAFHDSDKVARTKSAHDQSKSFATREYPVTAGATENAVRGSDLSIGRVTGGPPAGTSEDGKLLSRPIELRADDSSPIGAAAGKTRSIEEIRQLLNKGSR